MAKKRYVLDYDGERPEGDLVDISGDMADDLDEAAPEQFETIDDALKRIKRQGLDT